MRTIWLVFKHDLISILQQRSFWVLTLIVPLLMFVVAIGQSIGEEDEEEAGGAPPAAEEPAAPQGPPVFGLVDEANVLARIPPEFPPIQFVRFPSLDEALAALRDGQVRQVVAVPADFLARGEVMIYDQNFTIRSGGNELGLSRGQEWMLQALIHYNLTGDPRLAAALDNPTTANLVRRRRLAPPAEGASDINRARAKLVATYLPYLFYFLLMLSSNTLMRSVIDEKENRTAEVLLLSLPPRQLMLGKILVGAAMMLLQLVVWAASGALIFNRNFSALDLSAFQFPPGFFVWAGLYLALGYLLFAAVMAAGGALAVNPREVGQMTFLLVIPLLPTLMFGEYFLERPDSALTIGLSLFPFSAPSVVVTRLAFGPVPLWQLISSLALLGATAYLFLVLAGRFFQAGNLLSGEAFAWRRLLKGWRAAGQ